MYSGTYKKFQFYFLTHIVEIFWIFGNASTDRNDLTLNNDKHSATGISWVNTYREERYKLIYNGIIQM